MQKQELKTNGSILFGFLFLLSQMICGCSFFSPTHTLCTIGLPNVPAQWQSAGIETFALCFPGNVTIFHTQDADQVITPETNVFYCPPALISWSNMTVRAAKSQTMIKTMLPKDCIVPILAYPLLGHYPDGTEIWGHFPAGALVTYSELLPSMVQLTWDAGPVASLFVGLVSSNYPVRKINYAKILSKIRTMEANNPWDIRLRGIYNHIRTGHLTSNSFQTKKKARITVPFPPGQWVADNPFLDPIYASMDGPSTSVVLASGEYHFKNLGTDTWCRLSVTSKGSYVSFLDRTKCWNLYIKNR